MTQRQFKIWGRILVLILPATMVLWIVISALFRIVGSAAVGAYDPTTYGTPVIDVVKSFINWILGLIALIGIPALPVGIIFLVKGYKKNKSNNGQTKNTSRDGVFVAKKA